MGVPAFFRWLTIRYPKVVIDAISESDLDRYAEEYLAQKAVSKKKDPDPNEIDLDGDDVEAMNMATSLQ